MLKLVVSCFDASIFADAIPLTGFPRLGHCDGGFQGPSTTETSSFQCRNTCDAKGSGFYAYNPNTGGCSCYSAAAGCPDDGRHLDYTASRIESQGKLVDIFVCN